MDSSDWLKSIVHDDMDSSSPELMAYSRPPPPAALERRLRPQQDHALKCPRCDSANTKFCYYNNYSLSQPRYFCKTCRRYWTKGGSLRNVPVGGGCRKNKRSSSSAAAARNKLLPPPQPPVSFFHEATDLHLSTGLNFMDYKYCNNPMLSNCMYMGDQADGFHGGFGMMDGSHGAIMEACQRLALPFEEDVKPLMSLEWQDQGCSEMVIGRDHGCTTGLGLWAGMINGHGPNSAAI